MQHSFDKALSIFAQPASDQCLNLCTIRLVHPACPLRATTRSRSLLSMNVLE